MVKTVKKDQRLAILLSMAMFVLVVDTSFMNVSISAVVRDLQTTVSSVQGAIALEALISAAFILIGSKIGDLFGRKRAFITGLFAYAVGALAMTMAQDIPAVIVCWAIIGGMGASLLLPAMQSLIHSNFSGAYKKKVYAMVGASAAIAAGVGPLLGGFITTYFSWRFAFLFEALVIAAVLFGSKLIKDAPYSGPRDLDYIGAFLSIVGMGGVVLSILVWQEGGENVAGLLLVGIAALIGFAFWINRQKRLHRPALIDPGLFSSKMFKIGISQQLLQQVTLGGTMIALPIYLQMVLGYNAMQAGLSIAPLSLSMFVLALLIGRIGVKLRPGRVVLVGFGLMVAGVLSLIFILPDAASGWSLVLPLTVTGSGLGLLVSQLNNYTLAPISGQRISEAAGVNSASGSFGLSFGLAFAGAIMLATLSFAFTNMAQNSSVLVGSQKQQVATVLETDAEIMTDLQLQQQLEGQPQATQTEILSINTDARHIAIQAALLVPLVAGILGLFNSFRMLRLPGPVAPNSSAGIL